MVKRQLSNQGVRKSSASPKNSQRPTSAQKRQQEAEEAKQKKPASRGKREVEGNEGVKQTLSSIIGGANFNVNLG